MSNWSKHLKEVELVRMVKQVQRVKPVKQEKKQLFKENSITGEINKTDKTSKTVLTEYYTCTLSSPLQLWTPSNHSDLWELADFRVTSKSS